MMSIANIKKEVSQLKKGRKLIHYPDYIIEGCLIHLKGGVPISELSLRTSVSQDSLRIWKRKHRIVSASKKRIQKQISDVQIKRVSSNDLAKQKNTHTQSKIKTDSQQNLKTYSSNLKLHFSDGSKGLPSNTPERNVMAVISRIRFFMIYLLRKVGI